MILIVILFNYFKDSSLTYLLTAIQFLCHLVVFILFQTNLSFYDKNMHKFKLICNSILVWSSALTIFA